MAPELVNNNVVCSKSQAVGVARTAILEDWPWNTWGSLRSQQGLLMSHHLTDLQATFPGFPV